MSRRRLCPQVVLPPSSRYASEVGHIGLTAGAGSFVGGRMPSAGGGTYVRSGADGRGGTLKMLAPDARPRLKVTAWPSGLHMVSQHQGELVPAASIGVEKSSLDERLCMA